MAGLWLIGLLTVSLLRWVQALPSPTPLPTTFRHPVTPTPISAMNEALHRRGPSPTVTADSMSTVPASVCGYHSASLTSTNLVHCKNDYKCVFHAPNSAFGGMVGCCPPSNSNSKECSFKTACYDKNKLPAAELQSSSDPFMLSCTSSDQPYCVTYTYMYMDIMDYICGTSPKSVTLFTWATSFESGVGLILATKTAEVVGDNVLSSLLSRSHTPSGTPSHVANATPTASSTSSGSLNPASSNGSGSSISAGTIAGSVVGSVVAVASIVTTGVVFFLLKKRKQQRNDVVASHNAQDGYQSGSKHASPSGGELHPPVNVDGVPTGRVFGAEGDGPAHRPSGVEGSHPANVAHEMDGSCFIAELPARGEGNPAELR